MEMECTFCYGRLSGRVVQQRCSPAARDCHRTERGGSCLSHACFKGFTANLWIFAHMALSGIGHGITKTIQMQLTYLVGKLYVALAKRLMKYPLAEICGIKFVQCNMAPCILPISLSLGNKQLLYWPGPILPSNGRQCMTQGCAKCHHITTMS